MLVLCMVPDLFLAACGERAEARGPGANPASRTRGLNYATCSLVKVFFADTGCGHDIVSMREVTMMKRVLPKAKCAITFHTANGSAKAEDVVNDYVKELDEHITP